MNETEQRAILGLSLMAAFADGTKNEKERDEIRHVVEKLQAQTAVPVAAVDQDRLPGSTDLDQLCAALLSPESRQLGYEMAVCVCDADAVQSASEREFLERLRATLGLDTATSLAHVDQAESIAATPIDSGSGGLPSSMTPAQLDKAILDAAVFNGALELLPESLATMAIIPLQMKLVYRIGKSYGFELDRGSVKDFLATAGVGLTSQFLEQAGRKLLGGLLGAVGGRLIGGIGRQAVSSGMSFASTYALGQVARRYYAANRSLSTEMLRAAFNEIRADAKGLGSRYQGDIQNTANTLDISKLVATVREQ
ncbi:MAG: DUF533 domain-containing protein [Xanthomonadales bacterium]|nr:DUF533 domain-containing protein [Xanthomonadales bacterium]